MTRSRTQKSRVLKRKKKHQTYVKRRDRQIIKAIARDDNKIKVTARKGVTETGHGSYLKYHNDYYWSYAGESRHRSKKSASKQRKYDRDIKTKMNKLI